MQQRDVIVHANQLLHHLKRQMNRLIRYTTRMFRMVMNKLSAVKHESNPALER